MTGMAASTLVGEKLDFRLHGYRKRGTEIGIVVAEDEETLTVRIRKSYHVIGREDGFEVKSEGTSEWLYISPNLLRAMEMVKHFEPEERHRLIATFHAAFSIENASYFPPAALRNYT